jgi:hydroxymethylpyrimidine pyrophosphatase-like HAD family hydrolase
MAENGTIGLVAFDLDGTILDPAGRPEANALAALDALAARGIPAAAVSGRSIRRSLQPLAGYDPLARRLHICGYNGAAGVGPVAGGRRPLLYTRRLPGEVFLELTEYACQQGLNLVYCRCEEGDEGLIEEYRFLRRIGDSESAIDWRGAGYVWDPRLVERIRRGELGPPPKIMLFAEKGRQDRTLAGLQERFGGRVYVAWAVKELLEIMHPEVHKGVALQALSRATGVPMARIMAIGDGNNDLPMLRQAGLGVLMGNAEPEVRRAVEGSPVRLAPPFAAGGFARAIQRYVLDQGLRA